MAKKYYHLQAGDYLQSGDEFEDKLGNWKLVTKDFIGKKYGYDIEGKLPAKWPSIRRLVDESFRSTSIVPIQEQYGFDFED